MLSGLAGASGLAGSSDLVDASGLVGVSAEVLAGTRRVSKMTNELWESH